MSQRLMAPRGHTESIQMPSVFISHCRLDASEAAFHLCRLLPPSKLGPAGAARHVRLLAAARPHPAADAAHAKTARLGETPCTQRRFHHTVAQLRPKASASAPNVLWPTAKSSLPSWLKSPAASAAWQGRPFSSV